MPIASDWTASTVLQVRSGGPVNVITGADTALNGFTDNIPTQRVSVVPGQDFYGDTDSLTNYYNIAAFAQPAAGTLGDAPYNLLRGPGFWQWDQAFTRAFASAGPADRTASRSDQPDQLVQSRQPGGVAEQRRHVRPHHHGPELPARLAVRRQVSFQAEPCTESRLAVAVAMTGVTLAAHHGTSITYFVDKTITLEGVITEFVYGYPHPQVYFDVKKDGKVEKWGSEFAPTPLMMRNFKVNWSRDSIKAGDRIAHLLRTAQGARRNGLPGARSTSTANWWRSAPSRPSRCWLRAESSMKAGFATAMLLATATMALAQNPTAPAARPAARPPANPRDLSGKWLRTTPFQTYSNVKGDANEFQNEITQGRKPDLTRDTG